MKSDEKDFKEEFSLSKEALKKILKNAIINLSDDEIECFISSKIIDSVVINDKQLFYNRSLDSILESFPELRQRIKQDKSKYKFLIDDDLAYHIFSCSTELKKDKRLRAYLDVTYSAEPATYDNTATYCFYLPVPLKSEKQKCIEVHYCCTPDYVSKEDHNKRTAFWSVKLNRNSVFSNYLISVDSIYVNYEDCIFPINMTSHYEEKPLISFSQQTRQLFLLLREKQEDSASFIKRVYDYITLNYKYSFVRNYKNIDSISDLCIERQSGDCGSLSILMVSLLRMFGIESRVVGGMQIQMCKDGLYKAYSHDWVEIRTINNGWISADPFMGVVAHMYGNERARSFYLGNADPLRVITCNKGTALFDPIPPSECSDPYDNQIGEVFCNNNSLDYCSVIRRFNINRVEIIF